MWRKSRLGRRHRSREHHVQDLGHQPSQTPHSNVDVFEAQPLPVAGFVSVHPDNFVDDDIAASINVPQAQVILNLTLPSGEVVDCKNTLHRHTVCQGNTCNKAPVPYINRHPNRWERFSDLEAPPSSLAVPSAPKPISSDPPITHNVGRNRSCRHHRHVTINHDATQLLLRQEGSLSSSPTVSTSQASEPPKSGWRGRLWRWIQREEVKKHLNRIQKQQDFLVSLLVAIDARAAERAADESARTERLESTVLRLEQQRHPVPNGQTGSICDVTVAHAHPVHRETRPSEDCWEQDVEDPAIAVVCVRSQSLSHEDPWEGDVHYDRNRPSEDPSGDSCMDHNLNPRSAPVVPTCQGFDLAVYQGVAVSEPYDTRTWSPSTDVETHPANRLEGTALTGLIDSASRAPTLEELARELSPPAKRKSDWLSREGGTGGFDDEASSSFKESSDSVDEEERDMIAVGQHVAQEGAGTETQFDSPGCDQSQGAHTERGISVVDANTQTNTSILDEDALDKNDSLDPDQSSMTTEAPLPHREQIPPRSVSFSVSTDDPPPTQSSENDSLNELDATATGSGANLSDTPAMPTDSTTRSPVVINEDSVVANSHTDARDRTDNKEVGICGDNEGDNTEIEIYTTAAHGDIVSPTNTDTLTCLNIDRSTTDEVNHASTQTEMPRWPRSPVGCLEPFFDYPAQAPRGTDVLDDMALDPKLASTCLATNDTSIVAQELNIGSLQEIESDTPHTTLGCGATFVSERVGHCSQCGTCVSLPHFSPLNHKGIVCLAVWDSRQKHIVGLGTGTVIHAQRGMILILTCAHVPCDIVRCDSAPFDETSRRPRVRPTYLLVGIFPHEGATEAVFRFTATVVDMGTTGIDACVLRVVGRLDRDMSGHDNLSDIDVPGESLTREDCALFQPYILSTTCFVGDPVRLSGFSQCTKSPLIPNGDICHSIDQRQGRIVQMRSTSNGRFLLSVQGTHAIDGHSGCPILDLQNRVIGILCSGDDAVKSEQYQDYGVAVIELLPMLRRVFLTKYRISLPASFESIDDSSTE